LGIDLIGLKSQNTTLDFKLGDIQANAQTNSVKVEKEFIQIKKTVKNTYKKKGKVFE